MLALAVCLIIAAVGLFLIFPSVRQCKELNALEGAFIAHRGLYDNKSKIPENSLSAFNAAVKSGFAVETDIRLTADGEVVIFHDENLKRICGIDTKLSELSSKELSMFSLLGTDSKIPTLKQCLEAIDGRVPLLIEFKCRLSDYKKLCVKADALLSRYNGIYFVQSFCPQVLWWYRRNRREICRGQLASGFKDGGIFRRLFGFMPLNFIARPNFISYHFKDHRNIGFRICKSLGCFSIGWTFTDKAEASEHSSDFKAFIFENFLP